MKYFILFIILVISLKAQSQTTKIFLDRDEKVTKDSNRAYSFVLLNKMADTGWYAKEYIRYAKTLILSEGLYRDEKMKVPDGKFIYYDLGFQGDQSKGQVYSHIRLIGYYLHGVRTGMWVSYGKDGKEIEIDNYTNGKKNGFYKRFGFAGHVFADGSYVNDKREGDWHIYDKDGKLTLTDTYANGQVINSVKASSDSTSIIGGMVQVDKTSNPGITSVIIHHDAANRITTNASPDCDFKTVLSKKIAKKLENNLDGQILLQFMVSQDGKISSPSLMKGFGSDLDRDVMDLVKNQCTWHPALAGDQPVNQFIYCAVTFHDVQVSVNYSVNIGDLIKN